MKAILVLLEIFMSSWHLQICEPLLQFRNFTYYGMNGQLLESEGKLPFFFFFFGSC